MKQLTLDEAIIYYSRLQCPATLSPEYTAIDALRDSSLTPTYLLFEEGEVFWIICQHKGIVPDTDYCDFQSAYGYGGPIASTEDGRFLNKAWAYYKGWCWKNNVLAEFIRLHPILRQPYGGEKKFNRNTVCVPVGARYSDSCRNKVNKARRSGVTVHVQGDIPRFASEYRDGLKKLNADQFYYFNDAYFKAMSRWDKAHLLVAEVDQCWLSAAIFLEGGDSLEYHLSVTNDRGRDLAATNALIDGALRFAEEKGLKRLYLGGGKTTLDGDPLLEFKSSFGGELLPFYTGHAIHRADAYYAMRDAASDVPPVSDKVLWYR